jgi:hypothetical protein
MSIPPNLMVELAAQRQHGIAVQAERNRLVKEARAERPRAPRLTWWHTVAAAWSRRGSRVGAATSRPQTSRADS